MVLKKTKEEGSTNSSEFTPLYNGIKDSYGVDSVGYQCGIGVLENLVTPIGLDKYNKFNSLE